MNATAEMEHPLRGLITFHSPVFSVVLRRMTVVERAKKTHISRFPPIEVINFLPFFIGFRFDRVKRQYAGKKLAEPSN